MKTNTKLALAIGAAVLGLGAQAAMADCASLKGHVKRTDLESALKTAVAATNTGGYQGVTGMWLTLVDESGKVCEVVSSKKEGTAVNSGKDAGSLAWLGSRVISAQKANTANAFSLDNYAISTANLYAAVQEGGSLYGLQHSNPVDPAVAYQGGSSAFGSASDPLRNKRVGGINVFGGGLALYHAGHGKLGAIGVSGDTSCRDHAVAWQVRKTLGLDDVPNGITKTNFQADSNSAETPLNVDVIGDEMILKIKGSPDNYWDAWAQPECPNSHDTSNSGVSTNNTGTLFTANGTLIIPSP